MDEENIREPDAVITSRLFDSDHEDSLEERIDQLMSQGLSLEEATAIAQSQNEESSSRKRNMAMENKVAIMKQEMEAKERERLYANKLASEASSSSNETALQALEKKININANRFIPKTLTKIREALNNKKVNDYPMEISDQELTSIEEDINTIVKANRISEDDGKAILALFTTPFHEDSDYEGYNSGYDTSGGRRRTRRVRKSRKSRKSRRSRRSRKSRKSRKNKRK